MSSSFLTAIGLEVHLQLNSAQKLFSPAYATKSLSQSERVSPLDIGIPGSLPKLNIKCLQLAIKAALLFDCTIPKYIRFDRKHYAYGDLPLGYQITQKWHPIGRDGKFQNFLLYQVHLEQDTAKRNQLDMNYSRSGIPLLEIVTKPMLIRPSDAALETVQFCKSLRDIMRLHGVSEGNLEDGSMRVDINMSIHHDDKTKGYPPQTPRSEIKNVNGFYYIRKAIELMQTKLYSHSHNHHPAITDRESTWMLNQDREELVYLRDKMPCSDYRFMPDPDLPPYEVSMDLISQMREEIAKVQVIENEKIKHLVLNYPEAKVVYELYKDHPKCAALMEFLASNYFGKDKFQESLNNAIELYLRGQVYRAKQLLIDQEGDCKVQSDIIDLQRILKDHDHLWQLYLSSENEKYINAIMGMVLRTNKSIDPIKLKQSLISQKNK